MTFQAYLNMHMWKQVFKSLTHFWTTREIKYPHTLMVHNKYVNQYNILHNTVNKIEEWCSKEKSLIGLTHHPSNNEVYTHSQENA